MKSESKGEFIYLSRNIASELSLSALLGLRSETLSEEQKDGKKSKYIAAFAFPAL